MQYDELVHEESAANGPPPATNPWWHIWARTGAALDYVFHHQREHFIHRHFIILGAMFILGLNMPGWLAVKPDPIGVMIQLLILAPISGVVAGYIYAALARNLGVKLGGQEVDKTIMRAAIAWTNYPAAVAWLAFVVCYAGLHEFQAEDVQRRVWLMDDLIGYVPVVVLGVFMVAALIIRLRALAYTLNVSLANAAVIWLLTILLMYVPLFVIGGAFFTIFRTTVSVAQQAGS
ncbi:MAG: hypothetical protein AAGN35_16730 [Bacteroidota bacterium]